MALEYVMASGSARRLRLLAARSTYVIAGADRGQLWFRCGTGLYGRSSKKPYFQGFLDNKGQLASGVSETKEALQPYPELRSTYLEPNRELARVDHPREAFPYFGNRF